MTRPFIICLVACLPAFLPSSDSLLPASRTHLSLHRLAHKKNTRGIDWTATVGALFPGTSPSSPPAHLVSLWTHDIILSRPRRGTRRGVERGKERRGQGLGAGGRGEGVGRSLSFVFLLSFSVVVFVWSISLHNLCSASFVRSHVFSL